MYGFRVIAGYIGFSTHTGATKPSPCTNPLLAMSLYKGVKNGGFRSALTFKLSGKEPPTQPYLSLSYLEAIYPLKYQKTKPPHFKQPALPE